MATRKKQGNGKEVSAADCSVSSKQATSSTSCTMDNKKSASKKTTDSCCASIDISHSFSGKKMVDNAAIAHRAWEIWQREGCPDGRELEHWLRAEQELRGC
jgi:hypothetical protein